MCILLEKVCQSLSFEIFSFFPITVFFSQISYCRSLIKEENLNLLLISDGRLWLIKFTQTPRTPHCSVTQSNLPALLLLPLLSWDLSALCVSSVTNVRPCPAGNPEFIVKLKLYPSPVSHFLFLVCSVYFHWESADTRVIFFFFFFRSFLWVDFFSSWLFDLPLLMLLIADSCWFPRSSAVSLSGPDMVLL